MLSQETSWSSMDVDALELWDPFRSSFGACLTQMLEKRGLKASNNGEASLVLLYLCVCVFVFVWVCVCTCLCVWLGFVSPCLCACVWMMGVWY